MALATDFPGAAGDRPFRLRDLIGFGPDMFPIIRSTLKIETAAALGAGKRLTLMSLYIDEYDALRKEAIDLYVFQRDAYENAGGKNS
ncbi:MAG: hypothetical protein R2874_09420 [Desulfobacterales bacterium]